MPRIRIVQMFGMVENCWLILGGAHPLAELSGFFLKHSDLVATLKVNFSKNYWNSLNDKRIKKLLELIDPRFSSS